MSVARFITFFCDYEFSTDVVCVQNVDTGEVQMVKAKVMAETEGWQVPGYGIAFCPVHRGPTV